MDYHILILGSGGREFAIAQALLKKTHRKIILTCFGTTQNPGLRKLVDNFIVDNPINISPEILKNKIDLAIIGPEAPLQAGVADLLWSHNIPTVGPTKNHAQIETSKSYTRNLLHDIGLESVNPEWTTVIGTNYDIRDLLENKLNNNYVIKADGLRGGKGVKLSGSDFQDVDQALEYGTQLINEDGLFLVEEKLEGQEFSLISLSDGKHLKHFPLVQDYKRAYDDDSGPNTGGMGAITHYNHSFSFLDNNELEQAQEINQRVVDELSKRYPEIGYKGVLYGSFMKTNDGQIKVIEYNCRFGDPEVINLMAIIDQTDVVDLFMSIITETLDKISLHFKSGWSLCRYICPQGYPTDPVKNQIVDLTNIKALIKSEELIYAGVTSDDETKLTMTGSRALALVMVDTNLSNLIDRMNETLQQIRGPVFYRTDIGNRYIIDRVSTPSSVPSITPSSPHSPRLLNPLAKEEFRPIHESITYQESGVDIQEAEKGLDAIKQSVQNTHTNEVLNLYGSYTGVFKNPADSNRCLVSSMDGLGTKVQTLLHLMSDNRSEAFYRLGQDLFTCNINDLLCVGRHVRPLFFLDYFSTNKLNHTELEVFVQGISRECQISNCVLIGGETAEIRQFNLPSSDSTSKIPTDIDPCYEMVGTIVGEIGKHDIFDRNQISEGDFLIGIPSNGLHTNGYSLINRLIQENRFPLTEINELTKTHYNYYPEINKLYQSLQLTNNDHHILGLAHVTGGGLIANLQRIIPKHLEPEINTWRIPKIYRMIQKSAQITDNELETTFNCGFGMVMIVRSSHLETISQQIMEIFPESQLIGQLSYTPHSFNNKRCL